MLFGFLSGLCVSVIKKMKPTESHVNPDEHTVHTDVNDLWKRCLRETHISVRRLFRNAISFCNTPLHISTFFDIFMHFATVDMNPNKMLVNAEAVSMC